MFENMEKVKLRWRFDFPDKAPSIGMWSLPAQRPEDMAAYQNKEGLVRASIETQDIITQEIKTLAECDGWDFLNFQWISARFGLYQGWAKIVGLKLITRDYEIIVFDSGEIERRERRLDLNFATFGK
jgi:hypothetical protein